MPRLEGPLRDKDSRGNKIAADMKPINATIGDPSGTGEPSYEEELDSQPLVLSTFADVRAFLLSDDEAQESDEDILGAGEEISLSTAPYTEASDSHSSSNDILKKYDNTLPLTKRQL
ncbi:hypothetical protein Tco_0259457, partial [Tanacetum coccineum]